MAPKKKKTGGPKGKRKGKAAPSKKQSLSGQGEFRGGVLPIQYLHLSDLLSLPSTPLHHTVTKQSKADSKKTSAQRAERKKELEVRSVGDCREDAAEQSTVVNKP